MIGVSKESSWSFQIAGTGPGGVEYLHPLVTKAVKECDYLLGNQRALALFADGDYLKIATSAAFDELDELRGSQSPGKVCLLVSGDPGLFSAGSSLRRKLDGEDVETIANVSSPQILFARAGLSWHDVEFASLHGRHFNPGLLAGKLAAGRRQCLLLDAKNTVGRVCTELAERGVRGRAVAGYDLGTLDEKLIDVDILAAAGLRDEGMAVLYLEPGVTASDDRPQQHRRLRAVGVGPGAADNITIRGARAIGSADIIFAPRSSEKSDSLALSIAAPYVSSASEVAEIVFPMSRDRDLLESSWKAAAEMIIERLDTGKTGVFLTLGDATLYSTFAYVLRELSNSTAKVDIEIIPGISSIFASPAACRTVLVEGKQKLAVLPFDGDEAAVERAIQEFDTVVLLKIGKRLPRLRDLLERNGVLESSLLVSRLEQCDQVIAEDMSSLNILADTELGYLSTVVVRKGTD